VTVLQGLVLGAVQGVTEFLPISSSAHLLLVPYVFGWPDQGLAADAVVHLGTLGALIVCFRRELWTIAHDREPRRLAAILAVATVPASAAGLLFGAVVEHTLRSPLVAAASMAFWAVVMGIADRRASTAPAAEEPLRNVTWRQGLLVGVAQAVALVPGTSRSGITITMGLFAGLDRATAARFSFLLGIPITAAAGAAEALKLARAGGTPEGVTPLLLALLAALGAGAAAVWLLIRYLRRRTLMPFVVYRLILAALLIGLVAASR